MIVISICTLDLPISHSTCLKKEIQEMCLRLTCSMGYNYPWYCDFFNNDLAPLSLTCCSIIILEMHPFSAGPRHQVNPHLSSCSSLFCLANWWSMLITCILCRRLKIRISTCAFSIERSGCPWSP